METKVKKSFRRKTAVVQAYKHDGAAPITLHTLEGDLLAMPGDWIITGVEGEQYACKPQIFEKLYEPE
jgi:hypothetical protein